MGFFDKLFEKKECAICGGEIGLLGNRKLEDGNMCRDCEAKLSPWFYERRHSTIEQIRRQLAYREQNLAALKDFHPTHRIGENDWLIAEERSGVPYRFLVSASGDYMEENADLILFKDVSSCNYKVNENRRELMRTNDRGESVSHRPPRYEYDYDFKIVMTIENNPYFQEIEFKLNNFSVTIRPDFAGRMPGQGFGELIFGATSFDPNAHPEYNKFMEMCCEIKAIAEAGRHGISLNAGMEDMAQEEAYPEAAHSAAPNFCPNCGEPVSGGNFCGHCGNRLREETGRRGRRAAREDMY